MRHPRERPGAARSSRGGALMRRAVPTIAAAAAIVTTVALGQWQLQRARDKAEQQRERAEALARAPIPIGPSDRDSSALDGRRVRVEGRFVADRTVFLDNRTRQGVAGFHVVTPVRLEHAAANGADAHVLVLRGWIARDPRERTRAPPLVTPPGRVTIDGLALADLPQPVVLGPVEPEGAAAAIWQRLDLDVFRRWSNLDLLPVVVRQTSALDDGLARDWAEPGSAVDRHRGYAFQWFALAAAVAAAWLWFVVLRPRRFSAAR
jgi:cytochrome oxidase assembly protein ShyY1